MTGNTKTTEVALNNGISPTATFNKPPAVLPAPVTREKPFLAPVVEKYNLTNNVSSKLTIHMTLSIEDSGIEYQPGDACGVISENNPALVDEVLTRLDFTGEEEVELPKLGKMTLRDALLHQLVITKLTRKMIDIYANKANCADLLSLLRPEEQGNLGAYTWGRQLVDLLLEYPGVLKKPDELVPMLQRLTPRLYSVSSSPLGHPGQLHLTVAVVRYRSQNRDRGGVCSTQLADRVDLGSRLPIYMQENKKFRLPEDPTAPIIMIGPGTGVAPFRSFLVERRELGATGRNWLFFGERSAASDFLYRDDFMQMLSQGLLTRLDTAFSRDQDHKIYVQDRMLEQGRQFWEWLEEGAVLYVCGDALHMAKDVDRTLRQIIEQHGAMTPEAAAEYVAKLKSADRYHRDVY